MEKLKEFLKSPKKTAILGLIGGILMLLGWIVYFAPLEKLYVFGLIIYFVIILVRMFLQKGNLKVANYILIGSYIAQLLTIIPSIKYIFTVNGIVYVMSLIIVLLYFFNILLRKKNFVNNKVFVLIIILYTLLQIISVISSYRYGLPLKYSILVETIIYVINYIGYLFIIPYFYNYYNILKGENRNGK